MSDDTTAYDSLVKQMELVKDRIRGIAAGKVTGLYLYGRPGTGKTHLVRSALETLGIDYTYNNGHLTEVGLFDLLADNADRVVILDDLTSIFSKPIALQLLLGALGSRHGETGVRKVTYQTARGRETVPFTGAIIGMSNLALHGGTHAEVLAALSDRIHVYNYEPSDEQVVALMGRLADRGLQGVTPQGCREVLAFLVETCARMGVRPSARMFVDKAVPDYDLYQQGKTASHWHDLICSAVDQQIKEFLRPQCDTLSKAEEMEMERRVALECYLASAEGKVRVEMWKERTGRAPASYFRRIKELKSDGRLHRAATQAAAEGREVNGQDTQRAERKNNTFTAGTLIYVHSYAESNEKKIELQVYRTGQYTKVPHLAAAFKERHGDLIAPAGRWGFSNVTAYLLGDVMDAAAMEKLVAGVAKATAGKGKVLASALAATPHEPDHGLAAWPSS